jgi:hypothetical protein
MALTLRTNGSSGVNLVTAQWWNDYYNLLTGAMTDQIVTLKTDVLVEALGTYPIAPTLALAAGTQLGVGVYYYFVTWLDNNNGETVYSANAQNITTTTNNQSVSVSGIPTGPTGTAKRNLYRTKVGGGPYYLLTTIADNTTTTYSDTTADSGLSATTPPLHPSFGGSLIVKDGSGTVQWQVFSDGAVMGNIKSNGGGAAGTRIWVGTTDPGTLAQEGDIWIDA